MELPFAVSEDSSSSQRGVTTPRQEKQRTSDRFHASTLQESTGTDNDSLVTADSEESYHLSHQETDHYDISSEPWDRKSNTGSRVSSVLSHFGISSTTKRGQEYSSSAPKHDEDDAEIIDFTYVNVQETDADEVDILLAGGDPGWVHQHALSSGTLSENAPVPPNILALFLSGRAEDNEVTLKLVDLSEQANEAVQRAAASKQEFKLSEALDAHSTAARLFYEAALLLKDRNSTSMANSFLLLSQTEAKSALGLKRVIKLRPNTLLTKERLRATLRGALDKKAEADISDSVFLGTINSPVSAVPAKNESTASNLTQETVDNSSNNPVDDIMQLERELQNMDMGLELGNSIASLDSRNNTTRLRNSAIDGSFMVVPPGSNSYLSSSMVLQANPPRGGNRTVAGRARANRVQNMIEATSSTTRSTRVATSKPVAATPAPAPIGGLESSWWGTASQVLSSSVNGEGEVPSSGTTPTKQLMRLMDSLKTLGDENAALLREVEEAEAARAEARAAKKEMQRFREVYKERFEKLKLALEKFRKGYPDPMAADAPASGNPVATSEYMQQASTLEQLSRQEQLIRKLTSDLKKEKEENRKKDAAIRKYESFYREVKARSAQKAAQRRTGPGQQQVSSTGTVR